MKTLAVGNYRSLLKLNISLGQLNVVTGPNGVGKPNWPGRACWMSRRGIGRISKLPMT